MINLYHFSPCGTTEACAKHLIEGMGEEVNRIDLTSAEVYQPSATDVSVVAFPVYSGHVPPVVFERLNMALVGGGRVVALAVYGNRAFENALNEMNLYLSGRGYDVVALVAAVGQHSLCSSIAAGRPDADDAALLQGYGASIAEKLASGLEASPDVPENLEIKPYEEAVSPITTEECIACEICADECPLQVIWVEDIAESPDQCLGCARCIKVCPVDARKFPDEASAMFEQFLTAVASERRSPELFL